MNYGVLYVLECATSNSAHCFLIPNAGNYLWVLHFDFQTYIDRFNYFAQQVPAGMHQRCIPNVRIKLLNNVLNGILIPTFNQFQVSHATSSSLVRIKNFIFYILLHKFCNPSTLFILTVRVLQTLPSV